ncbi:cilia- and flagella-associated protein 43-like isoform X2 [Hemibagrus wyckioides]|uniref:cilia- and flagella-associated protein 43-like isoform X2 n=1 Tax=Hemibagrus wyckioides TaxID=337641 RepID=UPI00266BD391|nr:cilia- and flagella-associated protein 43-like isoform X2 [Hemibagrus wyckioides]
MFSKKTEDKLSEMADWKPPSQTPGEVLEEECQEYAETRRSLKKDVEELQEIIQAMMQENEKLPDTEKLELLEFNLDVDELQRLQELGEQEVAKVREEIELENLAKSYQRDVLKKKYWDSLSVKQKAIKAFHSGCEVENFPMNERTVKELEELSRVEAIREMEKADTSAPLEKDEKIKWLDVESLEFTGSLSAQYGGSNPHLYSQFDLHTRDQKMNQIILLQDVIYKVKTAFNTEFEAVYKQKEQEISRIRDRNKRIADIMSKLELQETLWEPTLSDNERPERALTVSDSEIKVEKYLTPEQRQREEEQRKEEEQRRLREKEDDSRARALDEMMGGILKVKKVDILKMILEERIKKLQASINESTQAFDEILSKLYERKLKSEMAIYQAKLKIVNLLRSIIIEEEMLDREEELIYELEEARAIENEIRKRLNNHREDVEAFQETYDNTVAEDKLLDRRFRKEFCDVPRHIVDQLYKLYKRRPRIQIMRALTDKAGSLKESPVLSQAATEGLSQIMKAMEELDAPQNMPEGLDPAVWERFCLARRTKVESEQKVKMKALVLAEKLASLQKITDEEQNAKMEFNKLVDELNCLRVERSTLCSNVMVQLLLKQGQVEVENEDFAADYSDSLLLHRNVVEDLNSTIRALGKQKIASMVECKDLRKTIIQKEWEYKRMSMQIEDLRNKARDIQMLHLSREVLEYLTEPDSDFRISKKVSSMEKTIALEEKTHRKNVKNCKRMIKELNKQIEEKKEINAALELQLKNMQVTVAERRNIYEARAWEEIQERKAKQRCRNVLQRRKLVDLAKAQDMEIAALSTELKSVRMKTFPAFS